MYTLDRVIDDAVKKNGPLVKGGASRDEHAAYTKCWDAFNRYVTATIDKRQTLNILNFGKIGWKVDQYAQTVGKARMRPHFQLADSFSRAYGVEARSQPPLPDRELAAIEELNFSKCAIRYSQSLTKDNVFMGLRAILKRIGEVLSEGQAVSIDMEVGKIIGNERDICFSFMADLYLQEGLEVPQDATQAADYRPSVTFGPPSEAAYSLSIQGSGAAGNKLGLAGKTRAVSQGGWGDEDGDIYLGGSAVSEIGGYTGEPISLQEEMSNYDGYGGSGVGGAGGTYGATMLPEIQEDGYDFNLDGGDGLSSLMSYDPNTRAALQKNSAALATSRQFSVSFADPPPDARSGAPSTPMRSTLGSGDSRGAAPDRSATGSRRERPNILDQRQAQLSMTQAHVHVQALDRHVSSMEAESATVIKEKECWEEHLCQLLQHEQKEVEFRRCVAKDHQQQLQTQMRQQQAKRTAGRELAVEQASCHDFPEFPNMSKEQQRHNRAQKADGLREDLQSQVRATKEAKRHQKKREQETDLRHIDRINDEMTQIRDEVQAKKSAERTNLADAWGRDIKLRSVKKAIEEHSRVPFNAPPGQGMSLQFAPQGGAEAPSSELPSRMNTATPRRTPALGAAGSLSLQRAKLGTPGVGGVSGMIRSAR